MNSIQIKKDLLNKMFLFYIPEIFKINQLIFNYEGEIIIDNSVENINHSEQLIISSSFEKSKLNTIIISLHTGRYSNKEPFEQIFNNTKDAINFLIHRFNVIDILRLIDNSDDVLINLRTNYIDKIKYFLEINQDLNIFDIEKRSVIIEKFK
jgi:hypothetical protein